MKARLPWFKFFPADHIVATADLSFEEDGALLRMLGWSWLNGPLPDSAAEVAKLIRAPKKSALVETLLCRFFTLVGSGYINADLEAQRQHAESIQPKRAASGTAGATARWGSKPIANAMAKPWQTPLYARSEISKGGICTDQENSTGLRLRPVGGES